MACMAGESISIAHLNYSKGFIVLPLRQKWLTNYYTVEPSTHSQCSIGHITISNFRQANAEKLSAYVTHRDDGGMIRFEYTRPAYPLPLPRVVWWARSGALLGGWWTGRRT